MINPARKREGQKEAREPELSPTANPYTWEFVSAKAHRNSRSRELAEDASKQALARRFGFQHVGAEPAGSNRPWIC